ncbi:MAG: hypothetical protein CMF62_01380 [Magnetococcales bacterium]|nr:hypothetical protein [Magnetococcales bacterium]
MVEYNCKQCGFTTNKKSTYISHCNRKTPCIPKIESNLIDNTKNIKNTINKVSKHKCPYCDKKFSRSDSLKRHINKTCKFKIDMENNNEMIYNKLFQKIEDLKNDIDSKTFIKENNQHHQINYNAETINNTKNIDARKTTNNITNNIQNNQNINVVSFGKEDMGFITDAVCKYLIDRGFKSIPKLVEFVHFNKNHPEYHNIYIPNFRKPYICIHGSGKWILRNRDETIEKLIDDKKDFLTEKFHNLKEELKPSSIKKFNRFLDQQDDDEVLDNLKQDIKLLLYNNRDSAKRIRQKN